MGEEETPAPRRIKVRYLQHSGREYVGRVTGEHYLLLPQSTGKSVVEIDERDLPALQQEKRVCCGGRTRSIIDVIG